MPFVIAAEINWAVSKKMKMGGASRKGALAQRFFLALGSYQWKMKNDNWKMKNRNRLRRLSGLRGRGDLLAGAGVITLFCLTAVFADLLAPYDYSSSSRREPFAPPTTIRFRDTQGRWHARPFICARRLIDPATQRYEEITDRAYPLELFTRGHSYEFLGLLSSDLHLFGVRAEAGVEVLRVYLLGADKFGRDRLSRLLMATRYSLLIGPIGALLASALGVLIGVAAGFVGGWTDVVLILAARATFHGGGH